MPNRLSLRTLILVSCEGVLIVSAVVAAVWARLLTLGLVDQLAFAEAVGLADAPGAFTKSTLISTHIVSKALLIAFVCQLSFYYADLYDFRVTKDRRELFIRSVQSFGFAAVILAGLYYLFPVLIIGGDGVNLNGQGVLLFAAGMVIVSTVGWRLVFEWVTRHVRARERLLLVGTGAAAIDLARELYDRRAELGVEIVGFVDPDPVKVGEPLINPGIVGTIDDIPAIAAANYVDRVVVSLADARGKLPMDQLLDMRLNRGIRFDHLASVYEQYTGKIALENLRPSWLIFSAGFEKNRARIAIKRLADIVVAAAGLILLAPVMMVVALAVRLTSPGPAIFRQKRVGQHGRVFEVFKFRSMSVDAEAKSGAVWATPGDDPRVTRAGRILRRTRLDELPQLWNVLIGNMSFVGPRPERPEFVRDLTVQIPFYGQRHVVKPGITGWAQVRYTYGASVEDAMEKLQYDLYYIKNMSLAFDLYIVFDTLKTVLVRSGS